MTQKKRLLWSRLLSSNVGPQYPGTLTAQAAVHLSLLPSGPDEVHETALRKTQVLQSDLERNLLIFR